MAQPAGKVHYLLVICGLSAPTKPRKQAREHPRPAGQAQKRRITNLDPSQGAGHEKHDRPGKRTFHSNPRQESRSRYCSDFFHPSSHYSHENTRTVPPHFSRIFPRYASRSSSGDPLSEDHRKYSGIEGRPRIAASTQVKSG